MLLDVVVVEAAAEIDPAPLVHIGADAPQDVPSALAHRILDPDHLGPESGEPLGRACARQLAAEVTDADASEGGRRRIVVDVHPFRLASDAATVPRP